ncbi:MAG: hypothetical protein J7467_02345, partial [Chloroflexus sp.]|nr:hypothetical protein [Chloroflexus sp.]
PLPAPATRRSDRAHAAHPAAPSSGASRVYHPGGLLSKTGTVYTFVYPRKKKTDIPYIAKRREAWIMIVMTNITLT